MPGGDYTARQNADGTWDIGPLPILPAHQVVKKAPDGSEEVFEVDAGWLNKAVELNQYRAKNGPYFSPLHIGHHLTPDGRWVDREHAGRITYNAVKTYKYQGVELPTMFGFLRWVPPAVYADIRAGKLAYLSAEVYDFAQHEVQGVALMSDQTPHFRLPMITIGKEVPNPEAAAKTAPAGLYRAVARRGKAVVYACNEGRNMPHGEAGPKGGTMARMLQAAGDIDDAALLEEDEEVTDDALELQDAPPADLPELEPVDVEADDELTALLDMPDGDIVPGEDDGGEEAAEEAAEEIEDDEDEDEVNIMLGANYSASELAQMLATERAARRKAEAALRTERTEGRLAGQLVKFANGMANYGFVPKEIKADAAHALKTGGKPALAAYIKGLRKSAAYQLTGGKSVTTAPPASFDDEAMPRPSQSSEALTFLRQFSPEIQAAGAKMYQEAVAMKKSGYSLDPERHVMRALEENGAIALTDEQREKYKTAG